MLSLDVTEKQTISNYNHLWFNSECLQGNCYEAFWHQSGSIWAWLTEHRVPGCGHTSFIVHGWNFMSCQVTIFFQIWTTWLVTYQFPPDSFALLRCWAVRFEQEFHSVVGRTWCMSAPQSARYSCCPLSSLSLGYTRHPHWAPHRSSGHHNWAETESLMQSAGRASSQSQIPGNGLSWAWHFLVALLLKENNKPLEKSCTNL